MTRLHYAIMLTSVGSGYETNLDWSNNKSSSLHRNGLLHL